MARARSITILAAVCIVLLCVHHLQATYVVVSTDSDTLQDNVNCAIISSPGLGLGSEGRVFVNCSGLTSNSTSFAACTTALATVTTSQAGTFPGALVTIDLGSASLSPGYVALEVGRLISMNVSSRVGLSFTNMSTNATDNIGTIANFIGSVRSYLTTSTSAPTIIVWIEDATNPCADGGNLRADTTGATLSSQILSEIDLLGTLGSGNGVNVEIAYSGIATAPDAGDQCGITTVAFTQGGSNSASPLGGACASVTPATAYGSNQLAPASALPTALQNATARTMLALGISIAVPTSVVLSAEDVTTLVGCLVDPGFTPSATINGTLLFRGVACGHDWTLAYAGQCREFIIAAVNANALPVIASFKFDVSNAAVAPLEDQVAYAMRAIANLSVPAVNVLLINAGTSSEANLGFLGRINGYIADVYRPANASETLNVLTRVPPDDCASGGPYAETMIDGETATVASQCARQTEFACAYSANPDVFALSAPTCGFDAAVSAAAWIRYSGPLRAVFNSPECTAAAVNAPNVVVGFTSNTSVPSSGMFSVGPTMVYVPDITLDTTRVTCATGSSGANAGYLSVACGSVLAACTAAITTVVGAAADVAVLPNLVVASGASADDVAGMVRTFVGISGVVGMQYTFEFESDAADAAANIGRIADVLNASVVRVGGAESSLLTQVVVLTNAVPCTETDAPGSGYLFAADENATLAATLAAIEQSSVFLSVVNAGVLPATDARCGFAGDRINFGLPLLPEYTTECNAALTASGVGLLSVDPQTFAPVAVTPGDGPGTGGDGDGGIVHTGAWAATALLLVLLSLAA